MFSRAYSRYATALLLLAYIFNQADRAIFSFLTEPIKLEFGLTDTQLGFLAGPAFALLYASLGIVVARWADRSHRLNIMSVAIALWSAIVMLTTLASDFTELALARIGVGVGEAGFVAVALSVIGDYHRSESERTRAIAHFMLAIPIAVALSSLVSGWVGEAYGWRAVFIAAGIPGIALALLMKATVREPPRRPDASAIAADAGRPPLREVLATIWRQRTLRHLLLAQALANIVLCAMSWTNNFFLRHHHMSLAELGGWFAIIGLAGGTSGIWLSGYLTSRLGTDSVRWKLWLMALAVLLVIPFANLMLWLPSKEMALLAYLLATVPLVFFLGPTHALVQSLIPASMRATAAAVFILVQLMAGVVLGTQMVGILSDALLPTAGNSGEALRLSMSFATLVALWAAAHFWWAGRTIRRDLRSPADIERLQAAWPKG